MSDRNRGIAAEGAAVPAWIDAKRLWRQFNTERDRDGSIDIRIGIAASFTAHNFVQFLGASLLSAGYRPKIELGPYNQLFQVCLDPQQHFSANCDVIALLWRIEDLLQDEIGGVLRQDKGAWEQAAQKLDSLTAAISALRSAFTGMIVVSVPALPAGLAVGPLSLDNPTRLGAFHRAIVTQFTENVGKLEHIRLLDLDGIQRQVGSTVSFDARQWYLYKQPFTDQFLHRAGGQLARIVLAARRSAKKCVVLDCDNTLWGGIVGEDGIDGIELGSEFPGSAFCDLQQLLLHWRREGVFLAILSKNNEADVWEVFDKHSGMVLSRRDISAWKINWLPKAENIAFIAEALNIGLDSLVFIDDSPMEVAYMRQGQPDVTSILLPEDPAQFVSTLEGLDFFDRLDITGEDIARVDMMRAEIDREELSAKMTKEHFLAALDLKIEFSRARSDDFGRVTQLINKTNQFNLTTIRRTIEEIRSLACSQNHRVYGLRVADRFGDYGLTGVAIIDISSDRGTWTIDSLMLSCRVLGRGVESALLAMLASDAHAEGATEFVGSYVPTNKNRLCATFLADHGFTQDGVQWKLPLVDAPNLPTFIKRVDGAGEPRSSGPPSARQQYARPGSYDRR
jgi:FkbH-like protein